MNLVINQLAEQHEIEEQRAALKTLEDSLAARETELALLQAKVREFELNYLAAVGHNFLQDLVSQVERQIRKSQNRLTTLQADLAKM